MYFQSAFIVFGMGISHPKAVFVRSESGSSSVATCRVSECYLDGQK